MTRVLVRSRARDEIADAFAWYNARSPSAADRFLDAVGVAIGVIQATPEQHPIVRGRLRRVLLRGFPYGVYYKGFPTVVSVVGVIHGSRHPDTWIRRAE